MIALMTLFFGCAGGPVDPGTSWTLKTVDETTRTSYWLRQGGDPKESVGPLGAASSCILAETSAGTYNSVSTAEYFTVSTALGNTELYHPLVPNSEKYSSTLATVVQERTRGAASNEISTMVYDPNSTMGNITTVTYADEAIETEAAFYGLAADEYVVRFPLGNIWMDPEEEVTVASVDMLTRYEPDIGDIWASENGNTVYIATSKEQVNFAGVAKKAFKVESYEVGGLQGDGADIIDQCFNLGLNQNQTNDPNSANSSLEMLFLDGNCVGQFQHSKTGSEWWFGSIMVKESSLVTEIEITNYGYEWYELDTSGTSCTRMTSLTYDNPNAILFVEYDLVTHSRESSISSWVE